MGQIKLNEMFVDMSLGLDEIAIEIRNPFVDPGNPHSSAPVTTFLEHVDWVVSPIGNSGRELLWRISRFLQPECKDDTCRIVIDNCGAPGKLMFIRFLCHALGQHNVKVYTRNIAPSEMNDRDEDIDSGMGDVLEYFEAFWTAGAVYSYLKNMKISDVSVRGAV